MHDLPRHIFDLLSINIEFFRRKLLVLCRQMRIGLDADSTDSFA